jgi:virulence-associated protein VapD
MFAIAFDLIVADTAAVHPKGVAQAYADIGATLARYGFQRIQGSVYVVENENLANLLQAMNALRALVWFPQCVRDIRAFRIEQWSDFTDFMKGNT